MSYSVYVQPPPEVHETYETDITYNLATMMRRAGFHVSVLDGLTSITAQPVVKNALLVLGDNEDYFKKFDPPNGYGDTGTLEVFLEDLLAALRAAPDEYVLRIF